VQTKQNGRNSSPLGLRSGGSGGTYTTTVRERTREGQIQPTFVKGEEAGSSSENRIAPHFIASGLRSIVHTKEKEG
jgi:hypothetical protein